MLEEGLVPPMLFVITMSVPTIVTVSKDMLVMAGNVVSVCMSYGSTQPEVSTPPPLPPPSHITAYSGICTEGSRGSQEGTSRGSKSKGRGSRTSKGKPSHSSRKTKSSRSSRSKRSRSSDTSSRSRSSRGRTKLTKGMC